MRDSQAIIDGYVADIKAAAADGGYLQVKQLAGILQTSLKKIRNDIERERLGGYKMGPEDSHCHIRIPLVDALAYVLQFAIAKSNLPPIEESPLFSRTQRPQL